MNYFLANIKCHIKEKFVAFYAFFVGLFSALILSLSVRIEKGLYHIPFHRTKPVPSAMAWVWTLLLIIVLQVFTFVSLIPLFWPKTEGDLRESFCYDCSWEVVSYLWLTFIYKQDSLLLFLKYSMYPFYVDQNLLIYKWPNKKNFFSSLETITRPVIYYTWFQSDNENDNTSSKMLDAGSGRASSKWQCL